MDRDPLTEKIIGSALEVHRALGPGLLESTYRTCLVHQLGLDGLRSRCEVPIPIDYKGLYMDASYRADLIVEGEILLEIKSVESLLPVHTAQTLTYLKLCKLRAALLMNFNETRLAHGIRRFIR